MTQPSQYRFDRIHFVPDRQFGPLDHHDGNAKRASGLQFGTGAFATGVFGDNFFNAMVAHQRCVIRRRERAARYDDRVLWQRRRRCRRVDEAQHIVVLRLHGKALEVLTTYSQQNTRGRSGQRFNGARDVRRTAPIITRLPLPWRTRQGDQRNLEGLAGGHCVTTHLRCEWVRRVHDVRDIVLTKVGLQAIDATKPADPMRDRLWSRLLHAARIGERRFDSGLRDGAGEAARFGSAAKDQEVVVHGR